MQIFLLNIFCLLLAESEDVKPTDAGGAAFLPLCVKQLSPCMDQDWPKWTQKSSLG